MMARLLSGLFLVAVCGFVVLHYVDSVWTVSIDLAHHYALVARLSQHWNLPSNDDPSLEEMNVYPRYSHRLAAIVGNLVGSTFKGMQVVGFISLAAVWSGLAILLLSLPRGTLLWCFLILALFLQANRLFIHLELFGTELVGNYFFPQVVAQGAAILLIALVLWLERAKIPPVVGYLLLASSVPLLQQFHLLPALEVLATLALLVVVNALVSRNDKPWMALSFGLFCVAASAVLTVINSTFRAMLGISENPGLLMLNYTPTVLSLTIECLLVAALSAFLIRRWVVWEPGSARRSVLALKYVGALGLATAGLCLLQVLLLKFGYGSEYACKKYAFGLNTLLVLDLLLQLLVPGTRLSALWSGSWQPPGALAPIFQGMFPGVLVLTACLAILPAPSARVISADEIVSVENFVKQYGDVPASGASTRYDYGIGLFKEDRVFDYLISIGLLKAPRPNDATDLLLGLPLTKPGRVGRIFTRQGSTPWDIQDCRLVSSAEGFVILDGQCVLGRIAVLRNRP